jgi:transcriptional regulator EpsA
MRRGAGRRRIFVAESEAGEHGQAGGRAICKRSSEPSCVSAPARERPSSFVKPIASVRLAAQTSAAGDSALNNKLQIRFAAQPLGEFGLTDEEGRRLLRAITDSLLIRCHYQLFVWLMGELQHLLPHDILVSAWGRFDKGGLKLDVISSLPGVRTEQIVGCKLDDLIPACYRLWVEGGREPRLLRLDDSLKLGRCFCKVHGAIRRMRSVVVHGVSDARGGHESLYIAFAPGPQTQGRSREGLAAMVNALVPQIDFAFRRVEAYPLGCGETDCFDSAMLLDLSAREREILDWVCRGKTNADIAGTLGISQFTVKNHVQRIFRKIGVTNRTEAAAKYYRGASRSGGFRDSA